MRNARLRCGLHHLFDDLLRWPVPLYEGTLHTRCDLSCPLCGLKWRARLRCGLHDPSHDLHRWHACHFLGTLHNCHDLLRRQAHLTAGGKRGSGALATLSRLFAVVGRLPSDEHVPISVITVPAGNDWQRIRVTRCTRDPPNFGVGLTRRIEGDALIFITRRVTAGKL